MTQTPHRDCSHRWLREARNRCEFARDSCKETFETINFLEFHFCHAWSSVSKTFFLCASLIIVILRAVQNVSDKYLGPAITLIANKLELSEVMAGATLVAFSNGASDILTAVVGATSGDSGNKSEGTDIVLGSLFGASIFAVLTIFGSVLAASDTEMVTLKSESLKFHIKTFLWTDFLLVMAGLIGLPMPILGGLFLMIYAVYTFRLLKISKLDLVENTQTDKLSGGTHLDNSIEMKTGNLGVELPVDVTEDRHSEDHNQIDNASTSGSNVQTHIGASSRGKVVFWILNSTDTLDYKRKSCTRQLLDVIDFLPKLLVASLIPATDSLSELEKAVFPLTNTFVHLYFRGHFFKLFSVPYLTIITLPLALIVLVLLMVLLRASRVSFTLLSSLAVLDLLINCVVDILRFIGIYTGVSMLFLCLSVMGIANSVVDLFVDVSLAKSGYQTMAVSGVFGGQLFNYLFGVGLAGLLTLTSKNTSYFSFLGKRGIPTHQLSTLIFVLGSHFAILLAQLWWMEKRDYKISKNSGKVFLVVYIIFLIGLSVFEFALPNQGSLN